MRPWSNSSSDWASWWSALTWSWVMGRWISLMSWSTAAMMQCNLWRFLRLWLCSDSSSNLKWLLRLNLRCLLRMTGIWLLRLNLKSQRCLKTWALRNDWWLWWWSCCWWRWRWWSLIRSLGWWSRECWANMLNSDFETLIWWLEVFILHFWLLLHDEWPEQFLKSNWIFLRFLIVRFGFMRGKNDLVELDSIEL